MNNYYELFGLERKWSLEEINSKLKTEMRKYRNRQNAADMKKVAEAEEMLEVLELAVKAFETEKSRKKYDEDLKKKGSKRNDTNKSTEDYINPIMQDTSKVDVLEKYYEAGNNEQVIIIATNLLNQGETDCRIFLYLAYAQYDMDHLKEAEKVIASGLTFYPEEGHFYRLLATMYTFEYKNYAKARDYAKKALSYLPQNKQVIMCDLFIRMISEDMQVADARANELLQQYGADISWNVANAYLMYADTLYVRTDRGLTYIPDQETYEQILFYRQKAYDIHKSDYTKKQLDRIKDEKKKSFQKGNALGLAAYYVLPLMMLTTGIRILPINNVISNLIIIAFLVGAVVLTYFNFVPKWKDRMLWALNKKTIAGHFCTVGKWYLYIVFFAFFIAWKIFDISYNKS